ncbi:MAG: ABC transporter permease subunit [Phycisphaeraceae bacterium]
MIQQLLSISRNTLLESIRQPIFVVLVLVGMLMMAINPSLAAYTLDNDNKLLVDLGLSTVFIFCLLLAAFTATGVLSEEIENRTVLTVISKPVTRPVFVIGKFLGVAGAIALAFYVLSLAFLFTHRHGVMQTASHSFDGPVILFGLLAVIVALVFAAGANYLYRWAFSSTLMVTLVITATAAALLTFSLDKEWAVQPPWADFVANEGRRFQITLGLLLVFEAVLVLTAVAIAASTRLGQIMTLLVCLAVFLIGLVNNSFSQFVDNQLNVPRNASVWESLGAVFTADASLHLKLFYALAKLVYVVLPDLQPLWPADALARGNPFSGLHILTVSAYSGLSLVMILCVAVILFQRREVG